MSQTPSHMRKVPTFILDDLSSKFLINLVSNCDFKFLFSSFSSSYVFCFVFYDSFSLMEKSQISYGCSSKLS